MQTSIIIVNWNGWKDTIECLESVLRLKNCDFRVVVCDNGSTDGSLEKIGAWARGELDARASNSQLDHLISPPLPKPIPFAEYTRDEVEAGHAGYDTQLVFIQVGDDLGYAGGNNVGMRYALHDQNCQFLWILNNDVAVEPDALWPMVQAAQQSPRIGLCGSLNLAYYAPEEVQMQGGLRYSKWTGRVQRLPPTTIAEADASPEQFDYINGASMLATRKFVETVGFMDETYLLYFEELDWVQRSAGRFQLKYVRESVIYHKEGAALGTSTNRKKRSLFAEKYASRNRIVFTKRYYPWAVPTVFASLCSAALHRLLSGDARRAWLMFYWGCKGMIGDLRNSWT